MRIRKFYNVFLLAPFLLVFEIIPQNKAIAQVEANYSKSKFKNWMAFRGQNGEFVQFPANQFWKPEPNLTLECWIRLNQPVPAVFQHIFGNCWNPNGSNFNSDWGFGFSLVNNRLGFHVIINGINQFETSNPNDTLSKCKWYHIAGVKEGQQSRLYVNGILTAERTLPVGPIRVSNGPANLGTNYPTGYNNWFDGNIDEFRLWNIARTQVQIQSTMNDTLLGNEAGLQAYYKFSETGQGSGITLINSAQVSGSQLNGTTISSNASFPKLTNAEVLPVPPPPLVPIQPVLCHPGGQFNLEVNSPTGFNINRFHWYSSNHPDTSRIPNTIRRTYKTPVLTQTDTFFVSSVNAQFCESRKSLVVAKVLPQLGTVGISASQLTFCGIATINLQASPFPNSKYFWFRGYSGQIPIFHPDSSSNLSLPNLDHSDTIWVQYKSNEGNCLSNKAFVFLTKSPRTEAPILSNASIQVCYGDKATFSVAGSGNRTVRLYSDSLLTQFITQGNFNQNIQTPPILAPQIFWVALSADANGCESFGSKLVVGVNPLPVVFAGQSDTICSGQTFQLGTTGSTNFHFQWTPAPMNNPPNLTISYNSDTLSNPVISFFGNAFIPIVQKFRLTATNRITGCKNADSVLITLGSNPPNLGILDTTICGSKTIGVSAPISNSLANQYDAVYQYLWNSNLGIFQNPTTRNTTISIINTGQVQLISNAVLTIKDSRTNCFTKDTVTIVSNPLPLVEAGIDTALCSGFSAQIGFNGPLVPFGYQWIPASGLSNPTLPNPTVLLTNIGPSFSTTYFLTATNTITGCQNKDSIKITSNALPVTNSGPDRVVCSGQQVLLGTSGNVQQIRYIWSPNTFLPIDTLPTVSYTAMNGTQNPINLQYTLSTENRVTKCRNRDTVLVQINPLPLVFAGNDTSFCSGFSVPIGFSGNVQTTHYQWTSPTGISNDTLPNPIFSTINLSGHIFISKILTATHRNTGCQKSDTIKIRVNALPKPNAGQNQEFCFNGMAQLGTTPLTGFQYNWSPTDSLLSPQSGQTVVRFFNTDTLSKNLIYVLEMQNDTTGCRGFDTVLVRVKGYVRALAGADKSFCSENGTSIGLPGYSGHIYSWFPTTGLSFPNQPITSISLQNPTATNQPDTIQYKRVVGFDGCQNSDSVLVVVFPRPINLQISGSKNVCPGTTGTEYLVVSNPYQHSLIWTQSGGNFVGNNIGDTVYINWGETNANGRVRFQPTNIYGCTGDSVIYNVQINKLLFPEIDILSDRSLVHNDSVCINQAMSVKYRTLFTTPGSSYQWNIVPPTAGAILGNPRSREIHIKWNGPGTYQLFVSQFDTTNIDTCFGTSQLYPIHILPSPDTTLTLSGDSIVCAFSMNRLYQISGSPGSAYAWSVSRPAENSFNQQSPGNLLVNFGNAGQDTIRVLETNSVGCKGKWINKPVDVKPLPNTTPSQTNGYNICPEKKTNLGYRVFGLPGSTFFWLPTGGFSNFTGQGTDSIKITWEDINPGLKVFETSAFGCIKDTLKFTLNFDPSKPILRGVSTIVEDDQKIEILFELKDAQNHPTKTFELWKNGNFLSVLNSSQYRYVDELVETQSTIYQYHLKTENSCQSILETNQYNNIVLSTLANSAEEKSNLKWNRYFTEIETLIGYEILRRVDGNLLNGDFGRVSYLPSVQPEKMEFNSYEIYDGFQQCYRIKADQNENYSYSNWSCVAFENPLIFPNLITPNGDGKNDVFEVKNLKLYPPAELHIFDRWGKAVFSTTKYDNDWEGPDGMYFYSFKSGNQSVKGWIKVMKQ